MEYLYVCFSENMLKLLEIVVHFISNELAYPSILTDYAKLIARLFLIGALLIVAAYNLRKEYEIHKKLNIILSLATVVLLVSTMGKIFELGYPVVSSGRIEIDGKMFEPIDGGKHYRLNLGTKIEDVELLFVSKDVNGHPLWRMDWVKHIDYFFKDDYIESRHSLNHADGKYTVIYKYRVPIWRYVHQSRKARESLEK